MRILPLLLLLALVPISIHSMQESPSPERAEDDPMTYVPIEAFAISLEECIPEGMCEDWLCRFCLGCFFIGMATQDGHNHF